MQIVLQGMRRLVAALTIASLPTLATAEADVAFFNGKTVNYVVATEPGGGYDTYGRLVAEFMQKYLPGSTFVVRNVPGAGHIIGANQIHAAKPDGLTIGTFNTGLVYGQIAGVDGIRFDLEKMSWIGKAATDPRVLMVSSKSGIDSVEQLLASKSPVLFGATGVGSSDYVDMVMLADALELPVQIISGYGGKENEMGMMRGEIQGVVGSRSSYEPFVRDGKGRFIAQLGGDQTDVPQLDGFAKTDKGREILRLMEAQSTVIRLTVGPPGIPDTRLEALRDAYRQALSDPELLERAKAMGLPIDPLVGEEVMPAIHAQFDLSPETRAYVTGLLKK